MSDLIEKSIELNFPADRVWRALADHNEFGEWFRVKLDGPFSPGEMATGHITHPGFEHIKWEARIERMDAPHVFSFTWHPYAIKPGVDYSRETPTLVEFRLEPTPAGTLLTIVETGFDALPDDRRGEAFLAHNQGWAAQTRNIQDHLAS